MRRTDSRKLCSDGIVSKYFRKRSWLPLGRCRRGRILLLSALSADIQRLHEGIRYVGGPGPNLRNPRSDGPGSCGARLLGSGRSHQSLRLGQCKAKRHGRFCCDQSPLRRDAASRNEGKQILGWEEEMKGYIYTMYAGADPAHDWTLNDPIFGNSPTLGACVPHIRKAVNV